MSAKSIIYGTWNEDGTATIQGRVVTRDGTGASVAGEGKLALQADISSITLKVFQLDTVATETYTTTLTVSSVIYNTLQTDATWVPVVDSIGYNFQADIPASAFPTGETRYRASAKFTTSGGAVGWGRWEGIATGVYTS